MDNPFRDIYAKFKRNIPLSDQDLAYLIDRLQALEERLNACGPKHSLSARAFRDDLRVLRQFEFHRRGM